MIGNASLDVIEEVMRRESGMYLKCVDRVNEWNVSAFVTAGNLKMILLHENKNEEGIRLFFVEVWELYVKSRLNPFLVFSTQFDTRVRQSAKKYL